MSVTNPSPASPLTHFDAQGQAHMVDVGDKATTPPRRRDRRPHHHAARNLALIQAGNAKKGDVLGIARIAGIQAAKKPAN